MRKRRLYWTIAIAFFIATFMFSIIIFNGSGILRRFTILKIENNFTEYHIKFEKVKAAEYYRIIVLDQNNNKVLDYKTKTNDNKIEMTNLQYQNEYEMMVYAYDKVGDYRACEEPATFTWNEPTFREDNGVILNDQDYTIRLDGKIVNKKYNIKVSSNKKTLLNERLTTDSFTIPSKLYKGKSMKLLVEIISNNKVLDSIELFNKQNPISNIKIVAPVNNATVSYNDVLFKYSGGDNASSLMVNIYDGKKIIKSANITKKQFLVSKDVFEIAKTYTLEIVAKYGNFEKKNSVTFAMSAQEQLKPVYISNNWRYVKKGSEIILKSANKDAKIYYTLDGSNPESFGTLYNEPIKINKNTTIKAVSVNEKYKNSIITTYNINVGAKKNLKVYLSPSNQHGNFGVLDVGYTNEMDEMNDLTDYIAERLKSFGVKVYRNNSAGNINQWNRDSNYLGVDAHIAIHSNASLEHDKYGIETWIDSENSQTLSLANVIQNNLMSIYPYKDKVGANRGVKYALGALGEVNDNYLPFGILIEVAHHDNKEDAEWIVQNKKLIGYNIADSILMYYQIIE